MIDFGLLLSAVVAIGLPTVLATRWGFGESQRSGSFLDVVLGPLLLGLAVARIAAMLLEDPLSISRLTELAVIRSGVEFWPGVAAAAGLLFLAERRAGRAPFGQLAALAPLAMVGAAGYEATCVVRDGCFGPSSPIGLRPPGITTTMLPIGWLMVVALVLGAVALHRQRQPRDPAATVVGATFMVAVVRAIGSFWLPHLGQGLTRIHWTSIAVAGVAAVGWMLLNRWDHGADWEEGRRCPPPDQPVSF